MTFIILFGFFSNLAKADPMKDFLLSCAYGTAAGAVVGLVSLAFTEDPSGKTNNIARGASLGLYAGMAFGVYVVYGENKAMREVKAPLTLSPLWTARNSLQGGTLNYQINF